MRDDRRRKIHGGHSASDEDVKPSRPTSETAKRVGAIMHRKETTRWSLKEIAAFKLLLPIEEADLASMERYYRMNWPPRHGKNILRTDLLTILNRWTGELDRANIWNETNPEKPVPRKIVQLVLPGNPEEYIPPSDPATLEQIARFEQELNRRNPDRPSRKSAFREVNETMKGQSIA